jgi:hypothetical protein
MSCGGPARGCRDLYLGLKHLRECRYRKQAAKSKSKRLDPARSVSLEFHHCVISPQCGC